MRIGKVFTHDSHNRNLGKVAGRNAEIGRRTSQDLLSFPERRFNGIERHGSNNQNSHRDSLPMRGICQRYA